MPRSRNALPQLNNRPVLTDGGLETYMIFHEGIELPDFAAYTILDAPSGAEVLRRYLNKHLAVAEDHNVAAMLDTTTWRANPDWVERVSGSRDKVASINEQAAEFLAAHREQQVDPTSVVLSGSIGPRGDGYIADNAMTPDEAADYHRPQVEALAAADLDLLTAYTLNYVEEAIGVVRAAQSARIPIAISFTVEKDGRLPTRDGLGEAIQRVDEATNSVAAYFMINCAHPTHFDNVLDPAAPWIDRLRGLRANSSTLSHEELDQMDTLDEGDPEDLGARVGSLYEQLGSLNVLGGCCGTDARHIASIAAACFPRA